MTIPASEPNRPQVEVELRPNGTGKVVIEGKDVSNYIGSVKIEADPMSRSMVVTLGLPHVAHVSVSATQAKVDDDTARILDTLGWMSPGLAEQRYAALCEALGLVRGDAPGWPTWDEIIDKARELKADVDLEYGHG